MQQHNTEKMATKGHNLCTICFLILCNVILNVTAMATKLLRRMLILNFSISLKKFKEDNYIIYIQTLITNFINTVDETCQKMALLNESEI